MQNDQHRPDPDEPRAIHVLMSGLIDYAGLFPPAKLPMQASVANYARYLSTPEAWMLGRFILPVSRLEEFRAAAGELLPRRLNPDVPAGSPWPISAIIDGDLDENLDSIFAFNHEHEQAKNGLAVIDAIELKVPTSGPGKVGAAWIDDAIELIPEEVFPFFEIPIIPAAGGALPDVRGMIAALAGADGAAKLRTGGVTADAFPPPGAVAEFLVACHAADVPFKATAGLHHACRAHYPLTYERDAPKGLMHGFLNLFLAAAFVQAHRADAALATAILEETDPSAFRFGDEVVTWGPHGLEMLQIAQSRETFALSYGSCSFEEPVEELGRLALI